MQQNDTKIKPLKMSFIKLAFTPFGLFTDNVKTTFVLAGIYAVILTALSIAMGFGYICRYNQVLDIRFYCSESNIMFAVYSLLMLFLFSVFTVSYYDLVFKNTAFSFKAAAAVNKKVLKVFAFCLLLAASCFTPFVSLYFLYTRSPNPDWIIETAYFAVVSIGFLIPFLLMRFYACISFFAEGIKAPSPKELWTYTSGNGIKILLSMMLIFILFVFVIFQFYVNFIKAVDENPIYVGIVSTFLYDFFILMISSIFINHCTMQKQIISDRS